MSLSPYSRQISLADLLLGIFLVLGSEDSPDDSAYRLL